MDFDQNIFTYFYRRRKRKKEEMLNVRKAKGYAVELDSQRESLAVFASAIFKKTIEIRAMDDLPYLSGNKLFLPKFIATEKSESLNLLLYRIIILHLWATRNERHVSNLNVYGQIMYLSQHLLRFQALLAESFPKYQDMYDELTQDWSDEDKLNVVNEEKEFKLLSPFGFERKIIWGKLPQQMSVLEIDAAPEITREALPDGGTEKENKKSNRIKSVEYKEEEENIGQDVFHHFEKIETLEEYKGIQRDLDGADNLEAHAEALDELNLEEVVRTSKSTQSLYKTELDMGFEVADLKTDVIPQTTVTVHEYDEWDDKSRNYRLKWCKVFHEKRGLEKQADDKILKLSLGQKLDERKSEVEQIKKKLLQLSSEIVVKKKLLDGPNIDIDNYIRNRSFQMAKISGDGRFYQQIIKRHRDMAVLLLVDNSLSADSWVQNRRVLDTSLEALLVFGEAVKVLGDPIMVAGFNSNTRNHCKFLEWKGFDENWENFKQRADSITPEGYTRIGPAIRHATNILSQRPEKHKLLLLFTDGRPTDYDRYEGQYGLSDVRKAVQESEKEGVITFAIAVDPSAKQFLPRLFGQGNYQILMNIQKFPEILSRLYIRLASKK